MLQRVYVGSHVDNIDVDRTTGNLWIGSHYVLHDISNFLSTYEKNKADTRGMISSSQVKYCQKMWSRLFKLMFKTLSAVRGQLVKNMPTTLSNARLFLLEKY